ncbi:MAG: septum formation family protein [Acidimicrobiales bacterium]
MQLPAAPLANDVSMSAAGRILLPTQVPLAGDASAEIRVNAAGSVSSIQADVTASVRAAASEREETKALAQQLTTFTIEWQLLDDALGPIPLPPTNQRRPDRPADKRLSMELRVGDCLNGEAQNAEIPVPCADPHRFEVFAIVELGKEGDPYPAASTPTLSERISQLCRTAVATRVRADAAAAGLAFVYSVPNEAAWTAFAVVTSACLAKFESPISGSVRR